MDRLLGRLSTSLCIATGVLLTSSVMLPAEAFTITQTTDTAGNPAQPLWTVGMTQDDVGGSFMTNWLLPASPSDPYGSLTQDLSASATYTLSAFTSSYMDLTISLTNTTILSTLTNANIMSFGFGVDPNATGVSFLNQGGVFDDVRLNSTPNFTGGFKNIDICVYAANNCSGGNVNQGLFAGATDTFSLRIFGDFSTGTTSLGGSSATLSDFPIKFQTSADSYQLAGSGHVEEVPEPLTILGTGLALAFGAGLKKEYDKRKKSVEA
ncbi:cistern family PEP-CTERM protein [Spirulina subsalsa]|nr:cistern family PEP-CTERM protein [Spirulina subsalsa]